MVDAARIVIPGRPVPKKNSGRIVRRGNYTRLLPSEAFEQYEKVALTYVRKARLAQFAEPVTLRCLYWLPDKRWWPDLVGLLQATSDILEVSGVLENDRLIVDYDGSRIVGLDKFNPRAEIEIRAIGTGYISCDPHVDKLKAQSLF